MTGQLLQLSSSVEINVWIAIPYAAANRILKPSEMTSFEFPQKMTWNSFKVITEWWTHAQKQGEVVANTRAQASCFLKNTRLRHSFGDEFLFSNYNNGDQEKNMTNDIPWHNDQL